MSVAVGSLARAAAVCTPGPSDRCAAAAASPRTINFAVVIQFSLRAPTRPELVRQTLDDNLLDINLVVNVHFRT